VDEVGLCVEALKEPPERAQVGAIEPGVDGVAEEVQVAAVSNGDEELCEIVDHPGEEITCDAASGGHVTNEEFIHRDTHDLKHINAA
jgi:hypothetical protein